MADKVKGVEIDRFREKLIKLLQHDNCPLFMVFGDKVDVLADYLIANGVTVQEWISVKDRLPEKDIRVLVWMKDNEEGYTQMDTDRWSCTMEQGYHWIRWGKSVTHWMPMPEPPKGE